MHETEVEKPGAGAVSQNEAGFLVSGVELGTSFFWISKWRAIQLIYQTIQETEGNRDICIRRFGNQRHMTTELTVR